MIRRLASFFTYIMRHYLPDAFLFAILLTFLSGILALIFTDAGFMKMITTWGNGIYGIIAFAFQMILILVTGHALALSPAVNRILVWIAGKGSNPVRAGMIVAFVAGICCFLSWGFGLIVGGLLALEIAKRTKKVDYPYLIAAGYSGFVIWHMGISGSIPLLLATAKSPQNFIEKVTGMTVPVSQTIFQPYNLIPALLIIFTLPVLFALMHPKEEEVVSISKERLDQMESDIVAVEKPANPTLAERIDHSHIINYIFVAMGLVYLYWHFSTKGFDLNLNIVIFIFFIAGVIFHSKPVNYIAAVNTAIKGAGGIALQFPLYGGIQGILIGTGLAKIIAGWFVAISSPETFYMFQFWGAGLINMFVPSGGGQWVVQGPITIEAARLLDIDMTKSAMMVAWGDQWTNMIQPFWALPLLGLAGLSAREIMGYTTMTLLWAGIVLSAFALMVGFGVF
ncbi:MAG: TIGR00366 family protein [Syntrophales bacterium]|nr:TIGR00366 family protein [Syntrophales bacterium]MDD5233348.1 TIGR00366 family protein [Syntrophales bacterium]